MEQKEIEAGNKLIAEFMGFKYENGVSLGGSWSRFMKMGGTFEESFPEAKYHTSWDWLMPVWIKIAKWGWDNHEHYWAQNIGRDYITIKNSLDVNILIPIMYGEITIEAVYTAIIQFIEYKNKEKV